MVARPTSSRRAVELEQVGVREAAVGVVDGEADGDHGERRRAVLDRARHGGDRLVDVAAYATVGSSSSCDGIGERGQRVEAAGGTAAVPLRAAELRHLVADGRHTSVRAVAAPRPRRVGGDGEAVSGAGRGGLATTRTGSRDGCSPAAATAARRQRGRSVSAV